MLTAAPPSSDRAFLAAYKQRRIEAIARGEDPDAKFKALIQARREQSTFFKFQSKYLKREKGYDPSSARSKTGSQRLSPEEEEEARAIDQKRKTQAWAGPGDIERMDLERRNSAATTGGTREGWTRKHTGVDVQSEAWVEHFDFGQEMGRRKTVDGAQSREQERRRQNPFATTGNLKREDDPDDRWWEVKNEHGPGSNPGLVLGRRYTVAESGPTSSSSEKLIDI